MLFGADANKGYLWTSNSARFALGVNSAERLTILNSGYVGVGTTNPQSPLHVNSATADGDLLISSDATNANAAVNLWSRGGGATRYSSFYADWSGNFVFSSHAGGHYFQQNGGGTSMYIDTNGRMSVGDGANTTGAVLNINGTGTGYSSMIVPRDTTALRPATGVNGMIRYNTTSQKFEAYEGYWRDMLPTGSGSSDSVGTDADALSALTVDFTNNTGIRATGASAACGTLNVTNLTAGKNYTVTILNATATCTNVHWNGAATNVKLPSSYAAGAPIAGAIYSFYYDGATVWVSMVPY